MLSRNKSIVAQQGNPFIFNLSHDKDSKKEQKNARLDKNLFLFAQRE